MPVRREKMHVRAGQEGWSLIELVAVFMMIGIVLAFALPMVANSMRGYNLRNAAERLSERLAGGRAMAMSKNKNMTISLTSSGQYGYDFTPAGAPDGTPDSIDPDDPTASYYVETLPSGVTASFTSGGVALANGTGVTYTSRGELPIGATAVDIVLTSSGRTSTVSVNLRGQIWVH